MIWLWILRAVKGLLAVGMVTGAALYLIMLEDARRQRAEDRRLERKRKEE